jgi:hypothetical protein
MSLRETSRVRLRTGTARATHELDVGSHLSNLLDLNHDQLVHLFQRNHGQHRSIQQVPGPQKSSWAHLGELVLVVTHSGFVLSFCYSLARFGDVRLASDNARSMVQLLSVFVTIYRNEPLV